MCWQSVFQNVRIVRAPEWRGEAKLYISSVCSVGISYSRLFFLDDIKWEKRNELYTQQIGSNIDKE